MWISRKFSAAYHCNEMKPKQTRWEETYHKKANLKFRKHRQNFKGKKTWNIKRGSKLNQNKKIK